METDQERRKFFAVAAKFSAVAVTLGLGGSAVLATSAEAAKSNPLQLLFHEAIKAGDMKIAFKKYGKQFPKEMGMLKTLNILYIHELTKIILYEADKLKKISAKLLGLKHFFLKKYGKFDI